MFSKDWALSLPLHRPYDCKIDLIPGLVLPSNRLYSLSNLEREAMEKYIHKSLAARLIRPSSSLFRDGFFFVMKKDKSLRPCIDYRGFNDITVKNPYPLYLIDLTFKPLHQATILTKLTLRNAYHLIRIREGGKWKTAFKTSLGHFEYLVVPIGLTNASAVFQALINYVLRHMLSPFVYVYLDEILIFSRMAEENMQHVKMVLKHLLENRLYVKAEKFKFSVASINFLGYVLISSLETADLLVTHVFRIHSLPVDTVSN